MSWVPFVISWLLTSVRNRSNIDLIVTLFIAWSQGDCPSLIFLSTGHIHRPTSNDQAGDFASGTNSGSVGRSRNSPRWFSPSPPPTHLLSHSLWWSPGLGKFPDRYLTCSACQRVSEAFTLKPCNLFLNDKKLLVKKTSCQIQKNLESSHDDFSDLLRCENVVLNNLPFGFTHEKPRKKVPA